MNRDLLGGLGAFTSARQVQTHGDDPALDGHIDDAPGINWVLAERIGRTVARRGDVLGRSYLAQSLVDDLEAATALATDLVAAETGLRPPGPARAVVLDREDWVSANIVSFRRLLAPLTRRLASPALRWSPAAIAARQVAAVELGAMLGWMSGRVLGQYDVLLAGDDGSAGDAVYYVGPNVLALEHRFGFPPGEFRLWLALHECTHRAQFLGVDWMRDHFVTSVETTLQIADPSPARLLDALRRIIEAVADQRSPFADGGLAGLLASPEQKAALDRIGGMMSLLEGHGDVTMDRAGAGHIPSVERFGRVLRARRSAGGPLARAVRQVTGLEAKLDQYRAGEEFIAHVEARHGPEVVSRAWQGPDRLPTLAEIRDPDAWLARTAP